MKKLSVYQMSVCAVMAALMCVLGPMSVPIGPVPVTLTNFVISIAVMLLGAKLGTLSCLIYLIIGIIGLPVFSGFQGGIAKLVGPTGGYLVGFLLMAYISGLFAEKYRDRPVIIIFGMILGFLADYVLGTIWFVVLMKTQIAYALSVCVFPFIPFDLAKIVIAVILGNAVYKALRKANLIKA